VPVESAADRAAFVNPDEFGLAATYTLAAGGQSTVNGVFDEAAAEGVDRNAALAARTVMFECRTADLPSGAAAGDTVTVGARKFRVIEIGPDQDGMTDVALD